MKYGYLRLLVALFLCVGIANELHSQTPLVGAYYFDGWSGISDGKGVWSIGMPTHVTKRLKEEYSEREPIWGWRDDKLSIMEKQIDLASKNGIDFFVFCWYWENDKGEIDKEAIRNLPINTSIELFKKAKNKYKMNFCVLICNHQGHEIDGRDNWLSAINYLDECYFYDDQYLRIDEKPVVAYYMPKKMIDYHTDIQQYSKTLGNKQGLFTIGINQFYPQFDANTWYAMVPKNEGREKNYTQLTSFAEKNWYYKDVYNIFPLVMSGWDKRAWSNQNEDYYTGRTPNLFANHLNKAFDCVEKSGIKHKLIFIYAWNELGEGGYIIPTKGDKRGKFLKRIKRIKNKWKNKYANTNNL